MFSFRNHFLKQKIYFLKRAFAKLVYYPANKSHTISPQTFNLPHYSSPLAIHSRDTLSDSPKIAPKSHRTHVHVIHTHTHIQASLSRSRTCAGHSRNRRAPDVRRRNSCLTPRGAVPAHADSHVYTFTIIIYIHIRKYYNIYRETEFLVPAPKRPCARIAEVVDDIKISQR